MAIDINDLSTPNIDKGTYQHYKGNKYEVIGTCLHSETLEPMVVYRPLYETKVDYWVRPYKMFVENVTYNGKRISRFQKID